MPWKAPALDDELARRMENAFCRASGVIGYSITQDRFKTKLMRDTATNALEQGMNTAGPVFMRLGRGALEFGSLRPGSAISLKDAAGEIMREFFTEANTAFQVVRASLYADAQNWLMQNGMTEASAGKLLESADAAFVMPSKDAFTQEALPLVTQAVDPSHIALGAGGAASLGMIVLIRAPIPGLVIGLAVASLAYYLARGWQRKRVERLVDQLPRRLYDLLETDLKANHQRYEAVVNAGCAVGAGKVA